MSDETATVVTSENTQSEPAQSSDTTQTTAQTVTQDVSSLLEGASDPDATEKKADTKEPDAQAEADKNKEPEGAPENYADFKAPEGVRLEPEVIKNFGEVAKSLNLSQEKAQTVIDKLAPVVARQQIDQAIATNKAWAEKTKSDPVIGGAHWKETSACAARALREFRGADGKISDPDVAEIAAIAGNHPGMIKIMRHFGQALREDRGIGTKGAAGKKILTAEDFYGKM